MFPISRYDTARRLNSMQGNEIPAESASKEALFLSKKQPHTVSLAPDAGKLGADTFYPDGSRSFDDLVSVISMSTADGSPFMMVRGGLLLHHTAGEARICFEDGCFTPPHKHNFVELGYVTEGQFHKQIEGKKYVFNRGDFFLLNRDISHGECFYRKNSAVAWLRLSNSFFDKSMNHGDITLAGKKSDEFFQHFILNGNKEYAFILFTPQPNGGYETQVLFKQISDELAHPKPGCTHIIIGYIERLLSLLPLEYQVSIEWRGGKAAENNLFERIRFLLEDCHEDVSLRDLTAAFGHNTDYFNQLIKRHTGMTYSSFLQNIRLEKAELLLKTTEFPVGEIARKAGYNNITYFYKIFTNKFQMRPNELRKSNVEIIKTI